MSKSSAGQRDFKTAPLILLSLVAVFVCIFIILFIIYNGHWIPVFIPSPPWSSTPIWLAFETPLIIIFGIALLLGGLVVWVIWRFLHQRLLQKQQLLNNYIRKLENELEKTQRLIHTAQHSSKHLKEQSESLP